MEWALKKNRHFHPCGVRNATKILRTAFNVWKNQLVREGPAKLKGIRFSGNYTVVEGAYGLKIDSACVKNVRQG